MAFDFDHTLVDDNSDLYVRKLAPNGKLPSEIKALYTDRGWTEYMGAIFEYLHANGTTKEQMLNCIREIQFVDGNLELLKYLASDRFNVIIISDANSVFIDCILQAYKVDNVINAVYTNPAEFSEEGLLSLQYYHTQDWCDLSTVNLCKGHILEDHIRKAAKSGIHFPVVAYVGDGTNDLCPSLRLKSHDYVFAREGFRLLKKLNELPEGEAKAKVVSWKSGLDVLNTLKQIEL